MRTNETGGIQQGYPVMLPLWYVLKKKKNFNFQRLRVHQKEAHLTEAKWTIRQAQSRCLHKSGFYISVTFLPKHTTISDANRYSSLNLVPKLPLNTVFTQLSLWVIKLAHVFFFVLISSWFKILDLLTWSLATSTFTLSSVPRQSLSLIPGPQPLSGS